MSNHPNRSSKTVAIRAAQQLVSLPFGSRTSWTVVGPYRSSDPHGPRTEGHADSYAKAVRMRSAWVARLAVSLMDRPEIIDTVDWIIESRGPMPVAALVSAALAEGPFNV